MATIDGVRRPGPQPRGDRRTIIAVLPVEQVAEYLRQADMRDLALSEYLCAELARDHTLAVPSYIRETIPDLSSFDVPLPEVQATSRLGRRVTIRVPREHHELFVRRARARGIHLSDYIRIRLAVRHRFDEADVDEGRRDLLSA